MRYRLELDEDFVWLEAGLATDGFDVVLRQAPECVRGASVAIDALHGVQHILRTVGPCSFPFG